MRTTSLPRGTPIITLLWSWGSRENHVINMAAGMSDRSKSYWREVDLLLPDGTKATLTVDLPTYMKVHNRDAETIKELVKNYNEITSLSNQKEPEEPEHSEPTKSNEVQGSHVGETGDADIRPTSSTRHDWTQVEVKKLLGLIKENIDKLNAARSKTPIWRQIAEEMKINAEKCQDKYKYLRKAYRNYVQANNRTGAAPAKFEFAEEMGDIMGGDPSVIPDYTASSDKPQGDTTINDESICASSEEGTSADVSAPKKSRKRSIDVMIDYLQERDENLTKLMKDMHHESMDAMNKLIDKF